MVLGLAMVEACMDREKGGGRFRLAVGASLARFTVHSSVVSGAHDYAGQSRDCSPALPGPEGGCSSLVAHLLSSKVWDTSRSKVWDASS